MKLLVLSDSHGDSATILRAIRKERPDMIVHLGDGAREIPSLLASFPESNLPLCSVRGNCDFGADCPDEELLELCGKRIFLTHGHLYGVKSGLGRLLQKGMEVKADLVLFGHTHVAAITQSGSVRLMNPGSVYGNRGKDKSYGIVDLDGDGIRCEIVRAGL